MRLLDQINNCPPFFLWYAARNSRAKLAHPSVAEVVKKSGLSRATVVRLSQRINWDGVTFEMFERYCLALNATWIRKSRNWVTLQQPHKSWLQLIQKNKLKNPLRHLSPKQSERFALLCEVWEQSRAKAKA